MKLNNFQLLRNVAIARLARKLSNLLTFDGNGQAQVEDSRAGKRFVLKRFAHIPAMNGRKEGSL